jgi:acyl-CoA thioesterase-1
MIRSLAISLGLIFLTLLGSGCGQSEPPAIEALKKSPSNYEGIIVAMGDSLTEGLGVEEEQAFPAQLQEKLQAQGYRYKVINAGISGETSSGARSRLNWVLTLKPDIVILETGANDGLRGLDPELMRKNIRHLVEEFNTHQVIVLLAGMKIIANLGREYTEAFASVYPQIASNHEIILIPFILDGVAGQPRFNQSDGIHPTAEGYTVVVENIYPYVLEAIKKHRQLKPIS